MMPRINIGFIHEQPQGDPLETPLHPKRRRRSLALDDYQPYSWSSISSSSVSAPEPVAVPVPVPVPEPAEVQPFLECGSAVDRRRQRPLSDAGVGILNFGSEEEDDYEDEDDPRQLIVPRGVRIYMEADEDTPQEAEAARVDMEGGVNVVEGGVYVVEEVYVMEEVMNVVKEEVYAVEEEVNVVEGVMNVVKGEVNAGEGVNLVQGVMNVVKGEVNAVEGVNVVQGVMKVGKGEVNAVEGVVNVVEGVMNVVKGEVNAVEGEMNGPVSLLDFEWREFPSTPISPKLRREDFVGSYGPTTDPMLCPYDIFVEIWDRTMMEEIARQTNIYAQQYAGQLLNRGEISPASRIVEWKDTNTDELYVYFALVMAMGITVKSKLEHYWTTDKNIFSTPGFSTQMPIRRFQLLSRCLHFADNTIIPPNITRSEAKVSKIKPIVDHLNSKFQALYGLGQNIALDESLTQWKGWLDIKQYIPNKASTVGIKTYEVCDSRSGYLWRFEVHSGGKSETPEGVISGSIPNLVLRLLQGLNNRGHTVWMDNYYNSPALARILKTRGFDCVGTLRTNRQFVPEQFVNLKKSDMREGQICGFTSGDVDVIVWRDQNRVAMISTYHGIAVSGSKPILIKDYNVCMGGVDKKDQMLSMYPIERKRTQVWYKKFFKRLLNVSILNAFIIHKHNNAASTHRVFRMELVLGLLERHQQRQVASLLAVRGVPKFSAEVQAHFPVQLPQVTGDSARKKRRLCVLCKKRTQITCNACDVALCFSLSSSSSCYMTYHT